MTRARTIAATIEAIAAYVDATADDLATGNDMVAHLSTAVLRQTATNIRRAEETIARTVEERMGPSKYDFEQEGMR